MIPDLVKHLLSTIINKNSIKRLMPHAAHLITSKPKLQAARFTRKRAKSPKVNQYITIKLTR